MMAQDEVPCLLRGVILRYNLRQDFCGVFAQQRRPAAIGDGCPFQMQRAAQHLEQTHRMFQFDDHAAMFDLRIVQCFVEGVDRAAGDFGGAQAFQPVIGIVFDQSPIEDGDQLGVVGQPIGVGGEADIIAQFRAEAQHFAESIPQRGRAHGDDDVFVARLEDLIGHDGGVAIAETRRTLTVAKVSLAMTCAQLS